MKFSIDDYHNALFFLCTFFDKNLLNEKQKRIIAGILAMALGEGGVTYISNLTGLNYRTITSGIMDVKATNYQDSNNCIRNSGGGRKKLIEQDNELLSNIEEILDKNTYGDPEQLLTWTNLSLRKISDELKRIYNKTVSKDTVSDCLELLGYSKQANKKNLQVGKQHPKRDEMFSYINDNIKIYLSNGIPVLLIYTKKKELVGNFKNSEKEYRKKGDPREVIDHDFPLEGGKVAPYGIYVVNNNVAFVNLGTSIDTGEFAVESIRRWWYYIGKQTFSNTTMLVLIADSGGSNGHRPKLWKFEIARLSEEISIPIKVFHLPPGTSKWNKVEHRLFSYISKNWEGKPLIDIVTIVNLICNTTTKTGLKVDCMIDYNRYERGIKISDDIMSKIKIIFEGPINGFCYTISGFT